MLSLVDERLLDIISWVELGRLGWRLSGSRLWVVFRENAAVFCLDCPEAALVVHFGSGELANAAYEVRVTARSSSRSFRRHFVEAALCYSLVVKSV